MNTRPHSIEHTSGRTLTRRAVLRGMASAALTTMSPRLYAQHVQMGVVNPPVQLDDAWLIDQTGKKQRLNDLLSQHVTALQTIYTGCSSVCPLQGALFTAVQDRLPHIRANHPVQLLSVGIDPLSDSPAVSNQCIALLGPAWKTRPLETANNHAWLSARNMPPASFVRM